MLEYITEDYLGGARGDLLPFLDSLELSFMKLSSFHSLDKDDCLKRRTPFSSCCTLSALMTSSISSRRGCVYSGLEARSKRMKQRAFVVVLMEANDTVKSPLVSIFIHSPIMNERH